MFPMLKNHLFIMFPMLKNHSFCYNLRKDGVWVGHLLSGYSLPMEEPNGLKAKSSANDIGGTWKQAIEASFEATKLAFPGGEIIAHLDHK